MHILYLIKTSEGAGWALNLLKEIKHRFPIVTFSVIIPDGGKHMNEYYEICRDVYIFNYKLDYSIFKQGIKFRKLVSQDNPDIIHSWFTQTTLYSRLFLFDFKGPILFQVVGPAHLENYLFKIGDIKSSRKNDYWIATSKYIFNKYKKSGVDEDRIYLNYAYTDILTLLETKEDVLVRDLRNEFNLKKNIKIIGTASYIYPPKFYQKLGTKGHEYLFDVFSNLLKQRDDVVLVIAGTTFGKDIAYEEKLKLMAKKISVDKIFFTGRYNNICEIISNFDVFVYLSKTENLGGVFESLLFEIPTISSNKGALPELVINGETGFNLDPRDIEGLTEKINFFLDNDSTDYTEKGKKLVLNSFKKDNIILTAFEIYKSVLEKYK